MPRLTFARAAVAAVVGLVVLTLLGGRSFASAVVHHLRPPAVLTNHTAGPIPFILDRKHKRPAKKTTVAAAPNGKNSELRIQNSKETKNRE